MLNAKFWGKCTKLASAITPSETRFRLPAGDGSKFRLGDDEHFYMTIRSGGVQEIVKVVGRQEDILIVERGQDNSFAHSFGKNACLCVEWNPAQLCEFVQSCVQGCTNITPQTFVVGCGTAIEINACGNIVNVNGSEKC